MKNPQDSSVQIPTHRNCTKCHQEKPLEEFCKNKRGKYGRNSRCKACMRAAYHELPKDRKQKMFKRTLERYHERQEPKRQAKERERQRLIAKPDKRCAKCGEVKPKSEFGNAPRYTDGKRPYCKPCHAAGNRKWRETYPDRSAEASARWKRENRERANEIARRHYHRYPEKCRQRIAEWRESNPELARQVQLKSNRKRRKRPDVRIHDAVGNRLRDCIKSGKDYIKSFDLLEFDLEELMRHLERQFQKGMSWDNFGEWHIDHIIPLSSFEIENWQSPDLKAAWHITNLRPIWASENLSKGAKIMHLI